MSKLNSTSIQLPLGLDVPFASVHISYHIDRSKSYFDQHRRWLKISQDLAACVPTTLDNKNRNVGHRHARHARPSWYFRHHMTVSPVSYIYRRQQSLKNAQIRKLLPAVIYTQAHNTRTPRQQLVRSSTYHLQQRYIDSGVLTCVYDMVGGAAINMWLNRFSLCEFLVFQLSWTGQQITCPEGGNTTTQLCSVCYYVARKEIVHMFHVYTTHLTIIEKVFYVFMPGTPANW